MPSFTSSATLRKSPRRSVLAILAVAVGVSLAPTASVQAQDAGAAPALEPLTFSAAQVAQGRGIFGNSCTGCHGSDLLGVDGPPLIGGAFDRWFAGPVGTLFSYVQAGMPLTDPGTLTATQTAALLAYILENNDFVAGETVMPTDADALAQMGFTQ